VSSRYTRSDVVRWKEADESRIQLKLAQLHDSSFHGRRDFVLSGLHLLHEGLGFTYVALEEPEIARNHFLASCQYVEQLFSLRERGEPISPGRLTAGYCKSWLVALAIGENATASSLASKFKREDLPAGKRRSEIEQIALLLKSLIGCSEDFHDEELGPPSSARSNDFKYYLECLDGIAERDEERFLHALERAADNWLIQIVRTHRGLPQSVCFIHGLGLLRLAEQVIGKPIEVSNVLIPSSFFPSSRNQAA